MADVDGRREPGQTKSGRRRRTRLRERPRRIGRGGRALELSPQSRYHVRDLEDQRGGISRNATKTSSEQRVLSVLSAQGNATASDVAAAARLGRSTAAKMLVKLERAGKARRSKATNRAQGGPLEPRPRWPTLTGARRH